MDSSLKWLKTYNSIKLEEIDSTNREAIRLAKAKVQKPHIITAERQTSGKGSKGRFWHSEPGNLYMSILLTNINGIKDCLVLPFIVANVLCEVLEHLLQIEGKLKQNMLKVKWPNDILLNEQKIVGILVEHIKIEQQDYAIIGIGLNVLTSPRFLDRVINTISLSDVGLNEKNLDMICNIIVNSFDTAYNKWRAHKTFSEIRSVWLKRAYKLGHEVTLINGTEQIKGIFHDINDKGEIGIKTANNDILYYNNGSLI